MYSPAPLDNSSTRPRAGPGRPPLSASPQPLPQQLQPPPPPVLEGPIALSVATPANNPQAFPSLTYRRPVGYGAQVAGGAFGGGGGGGGGPGPGPGPGPGAASFGSGVRGVDHLTRINMALQTQLDSEVEWALGSLLELSFQNPEIIQFKLQLKLLRNVLERIITANLLQMKSSDAVNALDDEYNSTQKGLEALLIIRNASLDPENGQVLAHNPTCLDIVVRGLNMPSKPFYSEFRSYCLDIAESISFHLTPDSRDDALFITIVNTVSQFEDRGLIIPALRCLARLVIRDERNLVESIPNEIIEKLLRFLLVDDEELISAVLDFFYQYTSNSQNVARLLTNNAFSTQICSNHLVRLLSYKIELPKLEFIRLPRRTKKPVPTGPPKLSGPILDELLEFSEPDRATQWIRTCFEEDPNGEVTQISLWEAYKSQFEAMARMGKLLLPAVDFIKNVASAFRSSAAMVVYPPDGKKRFIIKGIRPREYPIPPSVLNAPPAPPPPVHIKRREPSSLGVTATLVLQNIARSEAGKALLQNEVDLLLEAACVNPTIPSHIDKLLSLLYDEKKKEEQLL